jgi:hypothetical protein
LYAGKCHPADMALSVDFVHEAVPQQQRRLAELLQREAQPPRNAAAAQPGDAKVNSADKEPGPAPGFLPLVSRPVVPAAAASPLGRCPVTGTGGRKC